MKRYDIQDVDLFVNENSDCVLISDEYKNFETKMKFACKCGEVFETSFEKFKLRNKRQCTKCGRRKTGKRLLLSYADVKEFIEVTSQSGCKLLSKEYENAHQKLRIKCECGEVFETKFNHFKSSNQRQCGDCGRELQAGKRRLDYQEIKHFIEVESGSGCKLTSKSYKNNKSKIRIQCKCGNEFSTLFLLFRDVDRRKCDVCSQKENLRSKGELKVETWLISNGIIYDKQIRFADCKNIKPLPFDFVVYKDAERKKIKMIIEYDGKQHFGVGLFSSDPEKMLEQLNKTKVNDEIKNKYCFSKSIPLLRIPYSNYRKINKVLENALLN